MKAFLILALIAYLLRGAAVAKLHIDMTDWSFLKKQMDKSGMFFLVLSDCIVWPLTQGEGNYNTKEENMIIFERKIKEARARE
jgi:hypothetical protein